MKKFISGLIVGLLLAISLTAYAGEIITKINPFPIFINGEKQDIDAYNINGSTYIKLTDIAKATKGAVDAKFNNETRVIDISVPTKLEVNNLTEIDINYDLLPYVIEGKEYISQASFNQAFFLSRKDNRYRIDEKWTLEGNSGIYILIFYPDLNPSNFEVLLDNIPVSFIGDEFKSNYIPYDFYVEQILPLIN